MSRSKTRFFLSHHPIPLHTENTARGVSFQHLNGGYEKEGDGLFSRVHCDRTRGNGSKVTEGRVRLDIRTLL